jgi:hypothetical protein
MAKEVMTVSKLIDELSSYDKDMEIGYEVGMASVELLIGDDPDDRKSGAITINKPKWC